GSGPGFERRAEQLAARQARRVASRADGDRRGGERAVKRATGYRLPATGKGTKSSAAVERARRVLEIEADAVHALVARVGPEIDRAVEVLAETSGKVVVVGLGKSGIIARKIAATLASTGTPAFFVHAGEGVHGDLGMVV